MAKVGDRRTKKGKEEAGIAALFELVFWLIALPFKLMWWLVKLPFLPFRKR
jgi:hypothetical protein